MDKEEQLRKTGTYNTNSDKVIGKDFTPGGVLDSRDLLQVRYELVRAITIDHKSYDETSAMFGVSSRSARRYVKDLQEKGLIALLPERKGPDPGNGHKLSAEAKNFIDEYMRKNPHATGGKAHEALTASLKLHISKRTVERYISAKKAKRGQV